MARATGLQITETTVRIVDVEGAASKFRVLGAAESPIALGADGERDNDALTAAVKACFKASKARRERVILGLPASKTVIREIQIPFTDLAQINKVIKFEFESHLPAGGIDDYVVAFHKISESGPRSRVLVVAVLKSLLREMLAALARAGVEPAQVDLDAAALCAAALNGGDVPEENSADVLLEVDETTTTVVVTAGGRIRLVRSVRMGLDTLIRTLAQDLNLDPEAATAAARKVLAPAEPFGTQEEPTRAGETPDELRAGIIADRRNEFLRRLSGEVRRSLASIQLEGRITAVKLTGPACGSAEMATELEVLGAPVSPLEVFKSAEGTVSATTARTAATALGLALKGLEHDPFQLDFRQEEFQFAHRFDRVRTPLAIGAAALLILFGFLSIWQWNRISLGQSKVDQLAAQGRKQFKDLVVDRAKDPKRSETMNLKADDAQTLFKGVESMPTEQQLSRMLALLRPPMDHIEKSYGVQFSGEKTTDSPERTARSAVYRLDQFMAVIAAARDRTGKLLMDRLEVGSTKVAWSMRAESPDTFSILKEGFSKLDGFKSCEPGPITLKDGLNNYEGCRIEFASEN